MKKSTPLKSLVQRVSTWRLSNKGSFSTIIAIAIPVIFLASGAAVDYSRAVQMQSKINAALDSATIAAAKMMTEQGADATEVEAKAREYFAENLRISGIDQNNISVIEIDVDEENGRVDGVADISIDTTFMAVAGYDELSIGSKSGTAYSQRKVEVAFVLDTTGSMSGSRMSSLKLAMNNAIDTLIPAGTDSSNDRIRIALVPYSVSVRLPNHYRQKAVGTAVHESISHQCVTERLGQPDGSYRFEDKKPPALIDYLPGDNRYFSAHPSAYCPSVALRPLTSDRLVLKSDVNALPTSGGTGGHAGIQWGLNAISGNFSTFWTQQDAPKPYGTSNVDKYLIIMTDGSFNSHYYVDGQDNSNSAAEKHCTTANAVGDQLKIYSIVFDPNWVAGTPLNATYQRMQDCASKVEYSSIVQTGTELDAVFQYIAKEIKSILLTS